MLYELLNEIDSQYQNEPIQPNGPQNQTKDINN